MPEPDVQVRGGTVLIADEAGQIRPPGTDAHAVQRAAGLHVRDCRVLSRWLLRVDGAEPVPAGGVTRTGDRTVALLPRTARGESPGAWVVREQRIDAAGLVDRVTLRNLGAAPREVALTLEVSGDFADQFTLRGDGRAYPAAPPPSAGSDAGVLRLRFRWAVPGRPAFARAVEVSADPRPAVTLGDRGEGTHLLRWTAALPPGGAWAVEVRVRDTGVPGDAGVPRAAGVREDTGVPAHARRARAATTAGPAHPAPAPAPRTSAARVHAASAADLDGLVMPAPHARDADVPAAGPPWFQILAGRDGVLTALLAEHSHPHLLPGVLTALARTQGCRTDPARLEQPGKIVHELRSGPLADLGLVPYGRYYGSVDATPLFLLGLGRLADRADAGSRALVRDLAPAARAAVGWLRGDGGLDATGFVTYTPDPAGLRNHGWKDSWDAIAHPDGRLADGPIALVEVQAYTWAALRAAARCARDAWDDPGWAAELDALAADLRGRFHDRFWLPDRRFLALALDGGGAPVRTLTSNAGHALWSGVLDPDAAREVAARLASDDFCSGWSIRTVARSEPAYQPLSYHRGSCWPHDTALAMAGADRYGLVTEARGLAGAVVRAGEAFDGRLPELFAGFGADEHPAPVRYAYAARPQAWSAAAALAAADHLLR
ncbi:glycogen debranching N-terminal domain-containing protein [Cellulosimicrobium cellulans]|uniref:amylo-alpha-1,6-glucosidase n=1 Tax=Cellulosimicrobium cellulans TaxID=1710 RepID=UPI00130E5694|nr:glycogen debranching N-terminal domain-containing protein [Cellulosimicrobium cellulans]